MKPRHISIAALASAVFALPLSSATAFELMTNGLVAYYQLNGNGADSSGNGNNGTLHGTTLTADRFGTSGGALSFANENDYVSISDSDLNFVGTSFSISAWVRFNAFPTNAPGGYGTGRDIVRRGNGANYVLSTSATTSNEAATGFVQSGDGWANLDGNTGIDQGEWSLFTMVYDRSASALRLYVNGQPDTVMTGVSSPISVSDPTEIGNWYGTRVWGYPDFVGSIDDVLFYNRALSGPEVASLFDIPEPSSLLGILSFSLFAIGWVRRRTAGRQQIRN